jgi:antirestriction protein ArdC
MTDTQSSRFDVYRVVTESIIAAITAGAGTFVMPWHTAGANISKPENALTRMDYHGINVLALWAQSFLSEYPTGYWASYKQWQSAGGQVRRGERGATIVFFKQLEEHDRHDGAETPQETHPRLIARASRVFNAAQVDGWQPPEASPTDPIEIRTAVTTFITGTDASIVHGASGAWYDLATDTISMPAHECFVGSPTSTASEAYQATLLHELIHWTGAKQRLDRELVGLSLEDRAREELVAEIGAAFLCAELGVSNEPRPDHAAYVAHWLRILENDPRAVFAASRLAAKAATYLNELNER